MGLQEALSATVKVNHKLRDLFASLQVDISQYDEAKCREDIERTLRSAESSLKHCVKFQLECLSFYKDV